MFKHYYFALIGLLLLALVACKKEQYKSISKLKLKVVSDFSDLEHTPISIKKANTSEYLMIFETSGLLEYKVVRTNVTLYEDQSIINPYQIKDYVMLPDGRVLLSQLYYGDLANLVLISKDFSTREQFSLDLENPPLLHVASDGIIMISAGGIIGASEVVKYDFDFIEIWRKEFSGIRPYFSEYYEPTDQIYIVDLYYKLYELNGVNGNVTNEFTLSTEAWDITRDGNSLYVFGYENNGTYCGNDLEVLKLNLDGTEVWNVQMGRKRANDIVSEILVKDGLVYISGGYGELNCLEGITSNYSDLYVGVISDEGEVLGHVIENYDNDYETGSGMNLFRSVDDNVYLLGTKNVKDGEKDVSIYKVDTKRLE
jgi:hypothetical protein